MKLFTKEAPKKEFTDLLTKGTQITASGNISYQKYTDTKESEHTVMFIDVRPSNVTVHLPSGSSNTEESDTTSN